MQEYKLIVAGGRDFNDYGRLVRVLNQLATDAGDQRYISVVSGMAQGADKYAWQYCQVKGIQCYEFPAAWSKLDVKGAVIKTNRNGKPYNAMAGHQRNAEMAKFADGLLAFWDGRSTGTKNMIDTMEKLGKPVMIERY